MPLYVYRLEDGTHRELFQSMRDEPFAEIDGQKATRVPQLPGVARPWEGPETRSLGMGVSPDQIEDAMRECPDWKFDPRTGDALFESDSHQKRCYRQLAERQRRDEERLAENMARESERAAAEGRAPEYAQDIPMPMVD